MYEQMANKLAHNPNLKIAKIDMSKNEVDELTVKKLPTLKFYQAGQSHSIDIIMQKTESAIIAWLKQYVTFEWVEPQADEEAVKQDL